MYIGYGNRICDSLPENFEIFVQVLYSHMFYIHRMRSHRGNEKYKKKKGPLISPLGHVLSYCRVPVLQNWEISFHVKCVEYSRGASTVERYSAPRALAAVLVKSTVLAN